MEKLEIGRSTLHPRIELDQLRRVDPFALNLSLESRDLYYFSKRVMDLLIVLFALPLLAPFIFVIAVFIFLDTGLPIFFTQERVGAKRREFEGSSYWQQTTFPCYKFRTMVKDADESLHQEFAKILIEGRDLPDDAYQQFKANDPRVTLAGKILRRTSLDELPQLFNVLKGEMSLVGPRPVIPYEVDEYEEWHKERLAALPGITGLWQVSGRCQKSFDYMIRKDIEYIQNPSLWLDFKILLLTIPSVFTTRGAD